MLPLNYQSKPLKFKVIQNLQSIGRPVILIEYGVLGDRIAEIGILRTLLNDGQFGFEIKGGHMFDKKKDEHSVEQHCELTMGKHLRGGKLAGLKLAEWDDWTHWLLHGLRGEWRDESHKLHN